MEGNAYECKGSDFEKNILFRQLVANSLQYRIIGLVVPWDTLDYLFVYKLEALEELAREDPYLERSIEIYVVVQEDNTYFLNRWGSARLLLLEMNRVAYRSIPEYVKLPPEEKESEILRFLQDFEDKVREYIKSTIVEKGRNPPSPWDAFSCTLS